MDLTLQAKLLRAIQEREFERVGGTESVRVDVRIICATNADLREAIAARKFREDLYYRISTFPINLPPLRERKGDILLLADHFLKRFSTRQISYGFSNVATKLSSPAAQAMLNYDWPGNIRELESTIERAVLIAEGEAINLADLPLSIRVVSSQHEDYMPTFDVKDFFNPEQNKTVLPLEELKQMAVRHALEACQGNISEASVRLDISRSTMYRLLEVYNIRSENGRVLSM